MCKISAQYVKACRRKVRKTATILKSRAKNYFSYKFFVTKIRVDCTLPFPRVSSHNFIKKMNWFHVYCKRGYFRWGEISRKCWQDISRGGNFHDTTPFSFIKSYGYYFRVGVIFTKKTKARKSRKLPPRENFHVYSIFFSTPFLNDVVTLTMTFNT